MNKPQIYTLVLLILIFVLRVQAIGGIERPEPDPELEKVSSFLEPARFHLSLKAQYLLDQPQAGLLMGMVLGERASLPADFKRALRRTSTIHMVVVSGQNLTLLSGLIMNLAYLFGRRKTLLVTLGVLIFYAILTGLQIPVIRAAVMVLLASIAQFLDRQSQAGWILSLTGILMLIYQPDWLASISFQLSFLATFGVVVLAPEIIKKLSFLPNLVKQDLGVTMAAQLMVLPIIALNFHQASLVGIITNSLILWTVPLVMVTGAVSLVVSLVSLNLATILALVPGVLLTYFVYLVQFFNSLPLASIYIGKVSPLVWIGYYILILGVFLWIKQINKSISS